MPGDDPNVQAIDVEPDPLPFVFPADADVEEPRTVPEGHLAAGIDLVGPDPEVRSGDRRAGTGFGQRLVGGLRGLELPGPVGAFLVVELDEEVDLVLELGE